jgi:hypothetical protein
MENSHVLQNDNYFEQANLLIVEFMNNKQSLDELRKTCRKSRHYDPYWISFNTQTDEEREENIKSHEKREKLLLEKLHMLSQK